MKKLLNKALILGLTLTFSVNAFSYKVDEERFKDLNTEIMKGNKIDYSYKRKYIYMFGFNNRRCILYIPWTTPDIYKAQKNRLIEVEKLLPKMHEKIFNGENIKIKEFFENNEFKIISKNLNDFYEKAGCDRQYTPSLLKRYLPLFKKYLNKNKEAFLLIKNNTKIEGLKKEIDKELKNDEERLFRRQNNIDFLLKITNDYETKNELSTDYE